MGRSGWACRIGSEQRIELDTLQLRPDRHVARDDLKTFAVADHYVPDHRLLSARATLMHAMPDAEDVAGFTNSGDDARISVRDSDPPHRSAMKRRRIGARHRSLAID